MRVYIAGPYTKPDPEENTQKAIEVFHTLLDLSFYPFCPHLSHFAELQRPRHYDEWINYDIEWLRMCEVVLRLPGESNGADFEVAYAGELKIPVVYSITELLAHRDSIYGFGLKEKV